MNSLLALITAMAISMGIIPLMARVAPRLGMIDRPDPRKVHAVPVPRAGGVGIVFGALVPIAMWAPWEPLSVAYIFGALTLLLFGVWDDIKELGHYVKFLGQFIAVVPVVYFGNLYVTHLPFMDFEPLPSFIGKPFTVIAMMGMINAINHSDGLDGLAGGMSLLSLSCMAYLAYLSDGAPVILMALATLGGVFGFLRYNTHPAKVFMGDGGSQFLGFTLGFLAVYLVEKVNPAISPAAVALVLGLPIVDILAVFVQRIYHGMNWFRASKNHIHHRLLELGFHHYEAVVIIYSIQMLFVIGAIFLTYESDILILLLYLGTCSAVFLFLILAERNKWHMQRVHGNSRLATLIQGVKQHEFFTSGTTRIVATVIPLLFLGTSIFTSDVPRDFGLSSSILAAVLALLLISRTKETIALRAITYVTAAFVVYLETKYFGSKSTMSYDISVGLYVMLAISIWLAVRYSSDSEFRASPMDFLVIFIVLAMGIISHGHFRQELLGIMAVKLVVLFYGCEVIYAKLANKWNLLNVSTLITLSFLGARSLIW